MLVGVDAGAEAADREALFYSIREFFEAVARDQPTILVFEDVHWADDNLLDLILALATRIRALPIMFLTLWPGPSCSTCRRAGAPASPATPR